MKTLKKMPLKFLKKAILQIKILIIPKIGSDCTKPQAAPKAAVAPWLSPSPNYFQICGRRAHLCVCQCFQHKFSPNGTNAHCLRFPCNIKPCLALEMVTVALLSSLINSGTLSPSVPVIDRVVTMYTKSASFA